MITLLAGGTGAAKLALGFSKLLPPEELTIVGNTGDDIELFGLRICPDLDTMAYTLADRVNPETGWGIRGDSFACLQALEEYGADGWFKLGDRDLGLHLWRTFQLHQGRTLEEVTDGVCKSLGVGARLLPMTDSYVPTHLVTDAGELHVQEYLVREQCRPRIREIKYGESRAARPASGVEEAILMAEAIVICPSNPLISIGPILAVPGMRDLLRRSPAPILAVTPIVAQKALKGPADKMLSDLEYGASAVAVAELYRDFLTLFVLDEADRHLEEEIEQLGIRVLTSNTIMKSTEDKIRLAGELMGEV